MGSADSRLIAATNAIDMPRHALCKAPLEYAGAQPGIRREHTMERHDDREQDREVDSTTVGDGEHHATTGGAAAAGAVTGGVIGLTGGPIGAAIGAVGGAIVGAAAERMMHSDDDSERARAGFDNDQDNDIPVEPDTPTERRID